MIGVDIRLEAGAARVVADCAPLACFRNTSLDGIYACMVLEHLERSKLKPSLLSWKRALRSGGKLRLSVPDFYACARWYLRHPERSVDEILGILMGGEKNAYDIHHNLFDLKKLHGLLRDVGFVDIRRWEWQETPPHDTFDDFSRAYIPHMEFKTGSLMALNVEARNP
ncbi:MAG: methyltransferase [Candidatus Eisenbacteria bacterium]|nr:methyltransferase [Candidatus Eisenbacteria bacterium]